MQVSIWEQQAFFAEQDLIIVGSGFAGLWAAYELRKKHAHWRILIVEKESAPKGASIRNAGFACFGSPTELMADTAYAGRNAVMEIAEMRWKGIEKIKKLFPASAIDFESCGGYECLSSSLHNLQKMEEEVAVLNKWFEPITQQPKTFEWCNEELHKYGFKNFDALIKNKAEGYLHSGKLAKTFMRMLQQMNIDFLFGMEVLQWEEQQNGVILNTNKGIQLKARQVLFCLNAFTTSLFPQLPVKPARGQVLVTQPVKNLTCKGGFHFHEGFYYFRNIGNCILLGGARNKAIEEETTTEFSTTNFIQKELEHFLFEHILKPPVDIAYRWSGIMAFTPGKKPMVHNYSGRIKAVIACNGMGVALTPIIAEQIDWE